MADGERAFIAARGRFKYQLGHERGAAHCWTTSRREGSSTSCEWRCVA
jgi:hypothetical protein